MGQVDHRQMDRAQDDTAAHGESPPAGGLSLRAPYLIYFGDIQEIAYAKTGLGLIQWRRDKCVGQLRAPGCAIDGGLKDMSVDEAARAGAKSLIIGVASSGGSIPDHWLADLASAARAGLDIVSGMHVHLARFPEIAAAARASGAALIDVRQAPPDLPVGTGIKRSGNRLLTVGTDCAVGKKYTALAIEKEMRRRGWNADFRATGQTGIMIAGAGIPIDAVISDFLAGAAELISPAGETDHWDVIEGQGALAHPSYAGVSLGLLHGSQPNALVLCHDPLRQTFIGTETNQPYPIPSLNEAMKINLAMARCVNADCRFVGVAVNTSCIAASEREGLLKRIADQTELPTIDPIKDGAAAIVDRIAADFA
ncbi:DUF1611 domain-containing protein [Hyphococcus sp.]|uniref:DUF1611 domain-containing protein n=1 Tax=Hyphococcus sp. TaxID=2038636 RepID=UPI003CCC3C71